MLNNSFFAPRNTVTMALINDTCSVVECESTHWLGGAKGKCNNITNVCQCPSGYSGLFILAPQNFCYLHEGSKSRLTIFVAITIVTTLIIVVLSIYKVHEQRNSIQRHFGYKIPKSKRLTSTVSPSTSIDNKSPVERINGLELRRANKVLGRKKRILGLAVAFLTHATSNLVFIVPLLHNIDAYNFKIPHVILSILGIGTCSFWIGCYGTIYLYYRSLPDPAMLARKVGVKCTLAKWPRCKYLTFITLLFC